MKYILEVLMPYIVLLYVFDCITYVKTHHLILTSLVGNKFDLKRSGLHILGLLPTSRAIGTHDLPIHCTVDGIYVVLGKSYSNCRIYNAEDFNFIRFQDIKLLEVEGKTIKLNNEYAILTPSTSCARLTTKFINEIKLIKPADRKQRIKKYLSDSYNIDTIKTTEKKFSTYFTLIKIFSSYLFILVFIVLPTALYTNLSQYINLQTLIILIVSFYFIVLIITCLTYKKINECDDDHRSNMLLTIILSPVYAVHVLSYLTNELYFKFNYLTIAAYFMPRVSFKELARKEIFLMDYFENEIDGSDWQKLWKLKKELMQSLLDKYGISQSEISKIPEKQDQTANYYCPFCHTEYRKKCTTCIDCGIALKKFPNEIKFSMPLNLTGDGVPQFPEPPHQAQLTGKSDLT